MIDIRGALRKILLDDPAVNAAVGGSRIYPVILPQNVTLPSIVQNLISEAIGYHMASDDNLMPARVQFDSMSLNVDEAARLAGLVFDCMTGFSGLVTWGSGSPQSTVHFQGILHNMGRDDYDPTAKMFIRRRDFICWYQVRP